MRHVLGMDVAGVANDGPEALLYVIPAALATVVFVAVRMLLARRRRRYDPATSRS
ncbi:MAG TPA: hypothetical protein VFI35_09185 [Actinomycetota bacterium]|nr:hypothetical protein [Actinomycetota bacterium]